MKLLILSASFLVGTLAHAADSRNMTCAETRQFVSNHGAVILHYGDGLYDRYVSSGQYCERDQVTEPAWLPTSNSSECFVGYTCREIYGN